METQKHKNKIGRLLVLTVIATVFAELLSGSISLSRIMFLPGQFLVYGPAVILIREISRRLKAGWQTTLLLGLAFGLVLEGLTLQSVFAPVFMGNHMGFGRSFGVNWVWAVYMCSFHAFFSITTPILLTEVIYNKEADQPWAGKTALYIVGGILVIMLALVHKLFIKIDHFNTTALNMLVLAGIIVLLAFAAYALRFAVPQARVALAARPGYHIWVIWVVGLAASVLWFLGIATVFSDTRPPAALVLGVAPFIPAIFFVLISRWNMVKIDTVKDRFFLVSGLVMGEMVFGYFVTASTPIDHYGQIGLISIILILLGFLYRKVNGNAAKMA